MSEPSTKDRGSQTAMISSTAVDLPDHRREATNACLTFGVQPIAMEQLPASEAFGGVSS